MNQAPPALTRIADVVARDLEQRILEGSLKAGDRLPSERALALQLAISRPSLREAIQKLVHKGLLETKHGGGTLVTNRMQAGFSDLWQDMLQAHPLLQTDMLEFRNMLEGEAAKLAAERATDVDLERIGAAYAALERAYQGEDISACTEADVAFHQAIADASHNHLISHLWASLMRVIYGHVADNLVYLHAVPPHWEQLKSQHLAIWQAVRGHTPADAMQASREHIQFVRHSMDEVTKVQQRRNSALRRKT